jgi:type IV secretory pathway VirB2 component (pilin)
MNNIDKLRKWLSIIVMPVLLCIPNIVFATGGDSPVSEGLQYFLDAMLGTTGITIATVAIIGMGVACYFHVFEWLRFIQTVIGISIVFGAPAIVSAIQGLVHQ